MSDSQSGEGFHVMNDSHTSGGFHLFCDSHTPFGFHAVLGSQANDGLLPVRRLVHTVWLTPGE